MLVEEGFQRLVLQYDRVFTGELLLYICPEVRLADSQSALLLAVVKTPSCLWRRTGQIFKANTEYALRFALSLCRADGLITPALLPLGFPS